MLSIDKINQLEKENERLKEEINKIREGKCTDCIQHLITKSHKQALDKANKAFEVLQEIKEIATALYMNEWLQRNETARQSIQLLQEKIAECEVE